MGSSSFIAPLTKCCQLAWKLLSIILPYVGWVEWGKYRWVLGMTGVFTNQVPWLTEVLHAYYLSIRLFLNIGLVLTSSSTEIKYQMKGEGIIKNK